MIPPEHTAAAAAFVATLPSPWLPRLPAHGALLSELYLHLARMQPQVKAKKRIPVRTDGSVCTNRLAYDIHQLKALIHAQRQTGA